MALFGKKTTESEEVKQLKNEIKSLEFRKQTILSTFDSDIADLDRKKNQEFFAAGARAYEMWKENASNEMDLTEYWKRIEELNLKIEEKQAKKIEMEAKYNEELEILQASIGTKESANCPQCGASISAEDMFCEKCGKKLK